MKIIISEKQVKYLLDDPNIVNEQADTVNDHNTLIVLQNKINDILEKKQKEILDTTTVRITGTAEDLKMQIGKKPYPMKQMVRGVYAIVIPPNSVFPFAGSPMSALMPEIEKINEYKLLVEKHPELKDQIAKGLVNGTVYTDEQNQGTFKFTVTKKPQEMEDMKGAVPFGTPYPLGEFLERNKLIYTFKNGLFGTLESGQISVNLSAMPLKLTPVQTTPGIIPSKPIPITPMTLGDLFNYDDIEFKDENVANQQMAKFVQQMKGLIEKYKEPFIKFVHAQGPTVIGYSSIDGDPNQQIVGEYQPCAGNSTRKEYDQCLSQERAKKIAEMLNQALPELEGAFKFKGMGETNQFGPGWTKESPTIPEQTAANRRFVLTPINPYTPGQ